MARTTPCTVLRVPATPKVPAGWQHVYKYTFTTPLSRLPYSFLFAKTARDKDKQKGT
jgi:hypothetical protein